MPTLSPKVTIKAENGDRPLNKAEQRHVDLLAAMISLGVRFDDLDDKFDAFVVASASRDEQLRKFMTHEMSKLRRQMEEVR